MRTPITYYGGKQQLSQTISKLLAPHTIYIEPFIGGAAVFFAKEPSPVEIINDINGNLINFYEVLQQDFPALEKKITVTLHSRKTHRQAWVIYENPDMFNRIKRAWAIWVLANQSFGSMLDGGFGYDLNGTTTLRVNNKRLAFTKELAKRIENVQIECCDALKIISSRDSPETLFYLDPPYPDTNQGHYNGYSSDDFCNLLEIISKIKGKFLLSSFRHSALEEYTKKFSWTQFELKMNKSMSAHSGKYSTKIEVLTANYTIDAIALGQQRLF
ncbi:restriction endonuclease subunit M [Spirochaetia bacterium]|nr:restriction endonuclease subunit M [Spirochaetia bacterium]